MFFPLPPVEICNPNFGNGFRFEATDIDADSVRIGARNIEGFDAAVGAESVPGDPGVEGVGGEILLALDEAEPAGGNDQVEVGGHRADRTVAELDLELCGRVDLELHHSTVAASVVGDALILFRHGRQCSSAARPILDAGYSILDPPAHPCRNFGFGNSDFGFPSTHPNLPADVADGADDNRSFCDGICGHLRDLREIRLDVSMSRVFTNCQVLTKSRHAIASRGAATDT